MAIQKIDVVTKTGFVKYLYKYNSFGNIYLKLLLVKLFWKMVINISL